MSMHIGFQRSGGRGEYEVVGSHSGYTAISLEGWRFNLRWPDGIVRETGLELEPAESGKPRLRSTWQPRFQIGRILASMLLLPSPRREYDQTRNALPVAVTNGYVLSRIGFGPDTEFTGVNDLVTIDPTFVDLDNRVHKQTIGIAHRWQRIQRVYEASERLPPSIRAHVDAHAAFLASGQPVDGSLVTVVNDIVKSLDGFVVGREADTDPLPALESVLGIPLAPGPSLPSPDEIGEEEPVISARSAHEYRLAKIRGAAGRRFSAQVREAYNHRCAFCGARFGGLREVRSGVDAAHILAWSKHDLDIVPNGLALCKLHHWAFDAALLMPVLIGNSYLLQFTALSLRFDPQTMSKLGTHGTPIQESWLPADPKLRPSAKYLEKLYADLAIEFCN